MHSIRIIGPGRAGTSLAAALSARGWAFAGFLGRHDDLAARRPTASTCSSSPPPTTPSPRWRRPSCPSPGTTVVHLSGSLGLDALAPHPLRAAVHPLVPLPNGEVGAARLGSGVTFAVAGAPLAREMVDCLGGRMVEVADADRAAYHAAACIAANHVVALLGQVERVAASVGLDLESFLPLTRAAVDDVAALGAGAALTGPARRGDWATLSRHLDALPESERAGYQAGAALATRLAQADAVPARRPHVPASRCRPSRRRCRGSDGGGRRDRRRLPRPAGRGPVPPAGWSGWCPPWARCTTGTSRCMARARAECDVVAVSIFVNPLQFGDPEDIARYPRTLERDLLVCAEAGADVVFVPTWPRCTRRGPTPPSTTVSVRGVSDAWEGASRPGHFDGVATVVAKLFAIAGPCRAYFGLKDFQQLAVVRRMARELSLPVEVVGCPIVREPDGLALSSRNVRLSAASAQAATVLSRALAAGRAAVAAGERSGAAVGRAMRAVVAAEPLVQLDYAVVVDAATLEEVGHRRRSRRRCAC